MWEWILIGVVLFLFIIGIPVGYLVVWVGIIDWNRKYGKHVRTGELTGVDFRKDISSIDYNLIELDKEINNILNKLPEYRDDDLLSKAQLTFTTDLYGGPGGNTIKAVGAYFGRMLHYLRLARIYIIKIDHDTLKRNDLSIESVAHLFIHEYTHAYLDKHYKDKDYHHKHPLFSMWGR